MSQQTPEASAVSAETLKLAPGLSAVYLPELKPPAKGYSRTIEDEVLASDQALSRMNAFLGQLNAQGADIVTSFPVEVAQDRAMVTRTMLIVKTPSRDIPDPDS